MHSPFQALIDHTLLAERTITSTAARTTVVAFLVTLIPRHHLSKNFSLVAENARAYKYPCFAVKIMRNRSEDLLESLATEVKQISKVNHINICNCLEYKIDGV